LAVSEKEGKMTDPRDAGIFVKSTKVDMLAVTIGNVHGKYSKPPELDFPRLEAIRASVHSDLPLVLHGASGLSANLISGAISRGVCKFNVNTDLRIAAISTIETIVSSRNAKDKDVLQVMKRTTRAMTDVAEEKLCLFNKFLIK